MKKGQKTGQKALWKLKNRTTLERRYEPQYIYF